MKKTYNIVNGKKFTTKNNEEKTSWQRIGKLYINDDGSMFGRIDTIPIGFDGKFSCFEEQPTNQKTSKDQQPQTKPQQNNNFPDDFPF